jgi:DNA invertase Pin-like site-specific DNA recombinase
MIFGVYGRKSVYSDKSDSTESQAKICYDYIRNNYNDVTEILEYEDEGFTGANTDRPGFSQLMKDVLNKRINILVCYKIDRISRNVLDFSKTFDTLQRFDVQFVSVKEQIDTSTPLGRAMMYICSVFAQMERETTAERVKDSMIELAKSGKWAGGQAPIGYKRERVLLNGKYHTILIENKEELPFLNMIYDTFMEGYSLGGLETYFRKKGVKTLNGNYLSASQLHQILKNPHYVAATERIYEYFKDKGCIMATEREKFDGLHGIVVYGRTSGGKKKTHTTNTPDKWIVTVGIHEPIMSDDKWIAVQDCFGKNVIDRTRKYDIGLIKGILKCKCGYTMRVQHKIDKTYDKVYDNYYCQNRNRRGIAFCDMRMVGVDELDDRLTGILKQLSLNKNLLEKFVKQSKATIPIRDKDVIKKEIVGVKKKIENLTTALQDNIESVATKYIISEIEKLDKQIIGLGYEQREAEDREKEASDRKDDIDTIYMKICNYIELFDKLPYIERVKYLHDILKECVWDGEELSILL